MKPVLFEHPYIDSYPVMLAIGFFFAWLTMRIRARQIGLAVSHVDNLGLIAPLAGLAGGRFFARFFYAKLTFLESLQVWKGEGFIFFGGVLGATTVVLIYAVIFRLPILKLLDCIAPSLALGLAFGRIGCFMGGCCWGDLCADPAVAARIQDHEARARIQSLPFISPAKFPLAVTFPRESDIYKQHAKWSLISGEEGRSLPVHPVQLYESALAFILTIVLWKAWKRPHRDGDITIMMLLGYAFVRFCMEFLRADNRLNDWGLTFSQMTSLWIAAFCLICLVVRFAVRPDPVVLATATG